MRDAACVEFLQWALPRLGFAWPGFRKVRRQVCRRLTRRLAALGLADLDGYRRHLVAEPAEWAVLERLCRVTISRFFRDRGLWRALEREVLPGLVAAAERRGAETLGAWSAGCASGEEPYSLAILWQRRLAARFPALALSVVATDTDLTLLARARRGRYPAGSLREATALALDDAFEPRGDGTFELRPAFRRGVRFAALDLRHEAPNGVFDLVFCRNLAFTYYGAELQHEAVATIRSRLAPGGVLAVGSHERLPEGLGPWRTVGTGLFALE